MRLTRRRRPSAGRRIDRMSRMEGLLEKEIPATQGVAGTVLATFGPALFQDHGRERIDVGLQCDEHADKTRQHD